MGACTAAPLRTLVCGMHHAAPMVAPQYEEFHAHHLSCRRCQQCVLQRLRSISPSYPCTFPLQFLNCCSAQCQGMAHSIEELLRLAKGAIDRASPLLQDPVLLAARHLPPALSVYDHLSSSLVYSSTMLNTQPLASKASGHSQTLNTTVVLRLPLLLPIHHDEALLLPSCSFAHSLACSPCDRN